MELKKNPKKDLNKNRGLYFVSGLALIMLLAYVALEWKTYERDVCYDCVSLNAPDDIPEEIPPVILPKTPPPPPPPIAPPIFDIAPDDPEIEEDFFGSTESGLDDPIIDVPDVPYEEVEPEINVTWRSIEEVPIFPGCEDENDKRACFQEMMNQHIRKVFRYPEIAQEMGIQGKVFTQFTIAKDGTIDNVLLRGPDKILEKEAGRIISKLPKMKPGKQRDRNVKVAFTIPIIFRLN